MKRVISVVLVLFALAATAFFFLKMRRYLPERPRGAELAPPETIFFAQFPNLRQTALRIPQSDLYKIWSEPDVQAFLEKPRRKAPWMRVWTERFDDMLRVAPGEAFVAITALDDAQASFVGGFSFAGSQASAQALATHLREQLLPETRIVSSFRGNWYLCASDATLMEAMLARFDAKPGPALAASPRFQESVAPLGVANDLVLYGKPQALSGRLQILTELSGPAKPSEEDAVAMATKIEGAKMHDTIFLRGNGSPADKPLSRQTLSLASPHTLLYYAADMALFHSDSDLGWLKSLVPGVAGMEKRLAEKGLTWDDLPRALGPELAVMAEWPEKAALPTLLVASEINDAAKARIFMESLTQPLTPGAAWTEEDHSGTAVWNAPAQGFSILSPAVALTDRFALMGTSSEAVAGALPKAGAQAPALGQTAAFRDVSRFIPERASAFGYLDAPHLFDRVYRLARPFITLSIAFSAEAGAQFDAGKLPPVETVSKHLGATVLSQSRIEGGMLFESTGSLTIPELLLGLTVGGMAAGVPELPSGLKSALPPNLQNSLSRPRPPAGAAANPAASPAPPEQSDPNHK